MIGFNRMSVKGKLATALVTLGILPAIVIDGALYLKKQDIEKGYQENLVQFVTGIGEVIDRNLFERYGDVQAFGYNTAAYDPTNWRNPVEGNPLITAMNNYTRAYGLYPLMMLLDNNGDVLAVNSIDAKGKTIQTNSLYGQNFAGEKWFKDAAEGKFLEGTNGFTGTTVGEAQRVPLVGKIYGNDGYSIPFSAPVNNTQGERIGIWVNFADMALVEQIIGSYREQIKRTGITEPDVMIMDRNGVVVVDYDPAELNEDGSLKRDFENLLKKNFVEIGLHPAIEASKGKAGAWLGYSPDTKKEDLFAYTYTDGAYDYKGLGWSVIMSVDEAEATAVIKQVEETMLYIQAGMLAFSLIIGLWIGSSGAKPIQNAASTIRSIAEGKTDIEIENTDRADEIGDLARAALTLRDTTAEAVRLRADQERLKAEAETERKRAMHQLASMFEDRVQGIVNAVAAAATELAQTADMTITSTSRSREMAQDVASSAEKTAANVKSVASAAEELSSAVQEISSQLMRSNQLVTDSVHKAQDADERAKSLATAAEKVKEVVGLISEIASQTNLLALNATIESARAGEAGKGFAVVASEVKNLATQTGNSIVDINKVIQEMMVAAGEITGSLTDIRQSVLQISEASSGISSAVEEQAATTNEIMRNMQTASQGTSMVNQSVSEISAASEQANGSSQEVAIAARELSVQAEALDKQVREFLREIRSA